jgi:hypothetical protein
MSISMSERSRRRIRPSTLTQAYVMLEYEGLRDFSFELLKAAKCTAAKGPTQVAICPLQLFAHYICLLQSQALGREVVQEIATILGGDVDSSGDHELT